MDPAVTVRGLRKNYGATVAVDDVSFDVAGGSLDGMFENPSWIPDYSEF
jgi:ABC-type branched-subunit amino acid transport system ATPase component